MNAPDFIPDGLIVRKMYLDKALPYLDKDIVKILTGQRRVGKSYILFQLINHILQQHPQANICYINKELPEFNFIKTDTDLIAFTDSKLERGRNYLFIDEVQEITHFEQALRGLLASKKWDIWCTGSNSEFLSSDIAGIMSGRSIEIPVFSLTYLEFIEFHNLNDDLNSVNLYLKFGGLPYLRNLQLTENIAYEYIRGIYSTILFKDIIARHNIRNIRFVEDLSGFIADNTGSMVSAKKISDYLKSQQINIPVARVIEYLKFMCNAYFLIRIPKADLKGKRFFEIGEKYYFNDLGLRNSISGFKPGDINKILENVVLLHMISQGFKAFTGSMGNKEIDFVFEKNNERIYMQVAYIISDDTVYQREFGNLKLIDDNYPKYVITMENIQFTNDQGILHLRLSEFLKTAF